MKTKAKPRSKAGVQIPPGNPPFVPPRESAPFDGLATKKEASRFLRVCEKTIDRLIARKQLPKQKLGRATRIPWTAIHRLAGTDA